MFKFRSLPLVVISMMLVFGFVASPVVADTGGIKVDGDNTCPDPVKENNFLGSNVTAYVWLNAPAGADTTLAYEIDVQGNSKLAPIATGTLTFTQCLTAGNENYYWAPFTTPGAAGVYTMVVFSDEGGVIGKDTWRQ